MPANRPIPLLPVLTACLAVCAAVIGCDPSDSLEPIRQQQDAGNFAATIGPLREIMNDHPDDPEVNYLYGLALSRTGQAGLAEWSLSEAMNAPEWLERAGRQLAYNAVSTGNHHRAIEVTSKILDGDPDNVDVLLLRANAYARSRIHWEAALTDVDRILELEPDTPEAMEPRILSLLGLERIDEAAAALDELGEQIEKSHMGPNSEAWYCATTAIFADDGDQEERARELWGDCLERFPKHANVVTNGMKFFDARREYDRSLEILEAAHEADPQSRSYRIQLANRLRVGGRADESEQTLRGATESEHPQVAALGWFDLAKHFQEIGNHEQASKAQERAVTLTRTTGLAHPQLLLEYADALMLAGKFDEALAIADEMSLEAHVAMIRARVAQEQGNPAKALEHFGDAFRLWPNNPFARYHAALASEAVGDFDAAIEAYRYSIRVAPSATDARNRLARLHLAEGRPSEALLLLRLRTEHAPLDLEGELLSLRLWALLGNGPALLKQLQRIRGGSPQLLGTALASSLQGIRERAGAGAALRSLGTSPGVDLTALDNADALRAVVRLSIEMNQGDETRPTVEEALSKHPEVATFHEIHGLWLELSGDTDSLARSAYRAAIERDPRNPGALSGLGRLAQTPDEALGLFERAAAAKPQDPDPGWAAAQTLVAAGRSSEAEARLEELLAKHPYEARAAAALVEMRLERGEAGERTAELAHRAVRFGRSIEALDLLGRVHRRRDEPDLAEAVEARVRALRSGRRGEDRAPVNSTQD